MQSFMTGVDPSSPQREHERRVLVVDDNEAQGYALARCVRQAGYEVVEARSGEECLDRVRQGNIDLIVLDVRLPGISGIEVCRTLKNDPVTSLIPVIQTSALMTSSDDRAQGLGSGADAYLACPVNPRELLAYVKTLL